MYTIENSTPTLSMFLFKMHSIGSVRPVPRASALVNHWWNTPTGLPQPPPSNQAPHATQEPAEDVVVIQEEEMVLVSNECPALNQDAPSQETETEEEPRPQCMEPESTVSAPAPPSKSKPKKKQQKRR
jgi:hypothetical protein